MNRKGFSIPELLAVIVIMGILISIATASYNGISKTMKEKTYNNKLNLIKTKAIEYATDYGVDATTISVAKLISEGYLELENDTETNEKLNNPLGGYLDCYQVNINRELDDYDISVFSSDNCSLAETDILASNISITAYEANNDTLNNDNKLGTNKDIKWSKNDVYLFVEPSSLGEFANEEMTITWSVNGDNKEKNGHMATSANTDTTYANVYKIETSYLFDSMVTVKIPTSKGLLSKSVSVKIDKEIPTLTLDTNASYEPSSKVITFNGSDGSGSGFGKYAYALEEAETNNPTFNIESANNTWTVTENKTYYAYAIDAVGNVSKVVPISVTGIDNSKPVCKNPVNNSNWTNNSYTYNYGCKSDAGSGCATPDKEETATDEGEFKKVNWTVKDNIGNARDCSYNVATRVDKTAPTCEITVDASSKKGNNNWYIGNVKLLLSTNDNLSGVSEYGITTNNTPEYNSSKTTTLTNDTDNNGITYYGYVKDKAGNTGSCQITVKRLTQTPSCTLASSGTVGNNGWYRSNVNIKMTSNSSYVTNKNVNNTNRDNYTLTSDTKGTTIKGTVTNDAGLTGNCSISVKRDTEAPSCNVNASGTMGQNNWYTSNVSMSLSATDSTSGVASYGLNANSKSYNSRNSQSLTWDTSGITYYGIVSDNAGNQRDCSKWVKRLATAPSCNLQASGTVGNNGWYRSNVNIKMTSNSSYVTNKNVNNTNRDNYTLTSDTKGTTIKGTVTNEAGLTGNCSISVKKDTEAPSCNVNASGTKGWNNWYTSNVSMSLSATDATSGVMKYGLNANGTSYNNSNNQNLTWDTDGITYYGIVMDNAGNQRDCSSSVKRLATAPSCSITASGNKGWSDWYTSDITNTISSTSPHVSSKKITNNNSERYVINWDNDGMTVSGEVVNEAGLKGSCSTWTKRLAQTPSCSVNLSGTKGQNNWYISNINASVGSSSSHIVSSKITNNNSSNYTVNWDTPGITINGSVTNAAGKSASCSSWARRLTQTPSCSINVSGTKGYNDWYVSDVKAEISSSSFYVTSKKINGSPNSYTVNWDTNGQALNGTVTNEAGLTGYCSGGTVKREYVNDQGEGLAFDTVAESGKTYGCGFLWAGKCTDTTFRMNITKQPVSGIASKTQSWDGKTYDLGESVTFRLEANSSKSIYQRVCSNAGNCVYHAATVSSNGCGAVANIGVKVASGLIVAAGAALLFGPVGAVVGIIAGIFISCN